MSRQRSPHTTRHLALLDSGERSLVLCELLTAHPELMAEADDVSLRLLTTVSTDAVADDVVAALTSLDIDDLASRVRPSPWWLPRGERSCVGTGRGDHRAVPPRRATLRRSRRHVDAATTTALGLLAGLDQLGEPGDGTVMRARVPTRSSTSRMQHGSSPNASACRSTATRRRRRPSARAAGIQRVRGSLRSAHDCHMSSS